MRLPQVKFGGKKNSTNYRKSTNALKPDNSQPNYQWVHEEIKK